MPNAYSYSRAGNLSLSTTDQVNAMTDLARSDLYCISRRGITTFDFHVGEKSNTTTVYVSNDDGSLFDWNYVDYIDNYFFNNTKLMVNQFLLLLIIQK